MIGGEKCLNSLIFAKAELPHSANLHLPPRSRFVVLARTEFIRADTSASQLHTFSGATTNTPQQLHYSISRSTSFAFYISKGF
ncbi:hypothetical protein MRB53_040025 [Persea americana]|nr:hypothetical protein MRB53_040025 [Persea americana]